MLLTPDGAQQGQAAWISEPDPCCGVIGCYSPDEIACSLVSMLPNGPMWDRQKTLALEKLKRQSKSCAPWDMCAPLQTCETEECLGLATYAVYLAQVGAISIDQGLWAGYRESNPFLAVTTLENWLNRLEWPDCYSSNCSSIPSRGITPFEIQGECGPIYCPPFIPEPLNSALDSALVKALTRAKLGFIQNLDGYNWILEPLGVEMRPYYEPGKPISNCCNSQFQLCPIDGMIDSAPSASCVDRTASRKRIPMCLDRTCARAPGQSAIVWPALVLANCIVSAFFGNSCKDLLVPCADDILDECVIVSGAIDLPPPEPPKEWTECHPDRRPNLCGLYTVIN